MTGPLYTLGRACARWRFVVLDRVLPRLSIEGEEYFARKDAREPEADIKAPAPA